MKASLLAAFVALTFPACERKSPAIELPSSSSSTLVSGATLRCLSEVVINIDQHEKRIILEQHYDSDTALKDELVRRVAVNPSFAVFVRSYDFYDPPARNERRVAPATMVAVRKERRDAAHGSSEPFMHRGCGATDGEA